MAAAKRRFRLVVWRCLLVLETFHFYEPRVPSICVVLGADWIALTPFADLWNCCRIDETLQVRQPVPHRAPLSARSNAVTHVTGPHASVSPRLESARFNTKESSGLS